MLRRAAIATVALAAAAGLQVGWRFSSRLRDLALLPRCEPPPLDLTVVDLTQSTVRLGVTATTRSGDWRQDGIWGLEHGGGYDQVGAILGLREGEVVRRYTPLAGELAVGDRVRLDSFAFAGDPATAFGLPFDTVSYAAPLGDLRAWLVPGSGATWAVFVHGMGSSERESLRLLPTVAALDLPFLAVGYRNDAGAPASRDGYFGFGASEWEDLEAALRYGRGRGASDFVLIGHSMGGAIVLAFLLRSRLAEQVRGVILDAPMLDLRRVADFWAAREGLAPLLSAWGRLVSGLRFGLRWPELDYLGHAGELRTPTLLVHGAKDSIVPVALSDALAAARPDLVDYLRVETAGHVRAWNLDPDGYAARVRTFLARIGATA